MPERLKGLRHIGLMAFTAALAVLVLLTGRLGEENDLEARMERVLSRIEGAGRVIVLLSGGETGVTGAVIVAEGAGDLTVMLELESAAQALLGLDASRIEVLERGG